MWICSYNQNVTFVKTTCVIKLFPHSPHASPRWGKSAPFWKWKDIYINHHILFLSSPKAANSACFILIGVFTANTLAGGRSDIICSDWEMSPLVDIIRHRLVSRREHSSFFFLSRLSSDSESISGICKKTRGCKTQLRKDFM